MNFWIFLLLEEYKKILICTTLEISYLLQHRNLKQVFLVNMVTGITT